MFSFFGRKKSSAEVAQEDISIPGANNDDFIFIGKKPDQQNPPDNTSSIYPNTFPYSKNSIHSIPVNYLQGVPFKIAPELNDHNSSDSSQILVDEIIAVLTKMLQFESDYSFSMEREITSQ